VVVYVCGRNGGEADTRQALVSSATPRNAVKAEAPRQGEQAPPARHQATGALSATPPPANPRLPIPSDDRCRPPSPFYNRFAFMESLSPRLHRDDKSSGAHSHHQGTTVRAPCSGASQANGHVSHQALSPVTATMEGSHVDISRRSSLLEICFVSVSCIRSICCAIRRPNHHRSVPAASLQLST
jgi:hypothetical protein